MKASAVVSRQDSVACNAACRLQLLTVVRFTPRLSTGMTEYRTVLQEVPRGPTHVMRVGERLDVGYHWPRLDCAKRDQRQRDNDRHVHKQVIIHRRLRLK